MAEARKWGSRLWYFSPPDRCRKIPTRGDRIRLRGGGLASMKVVLLVTGMMLAGTARAEPESSTWKKSFLLSRAGDAWAKGHYPEAEKLFGTVLTLDPDDDVALLHVGVLARRRGQLDKAIALMSRGAAAHPTHFPLQFELGATLLMASRPKDAVPHLLAATQANPKSLDARVNLGDALSLTGQRDAAYPHYLWAVDLDPTSGWAQRQLGVCAFELQRPADAVTHLQLAKPTFPADAGLELVLGHAQLQLGNDAAALEAYQRVIALAPKSDAGPLFAGTALEKLGRLDEARKRYEQAIALKPSSASARIHLANLMRAQGQIVTARAQYEMALKAEPKNTWGLSLLGFLELETKRPARAQVLLARAVALAPADAEAGVGLGDAYQALHKPNEARKAYDAVLTRHPTNLSALVKSGDMLREKGDLERALKRYSDAARLHSKSTWALVSLGDALRLSGRIDAAKTQYEAAVVAEPNSAWAQRQLGYALFELGDEKGAFERLSPLATDDNQEPDLLLVLGHLAMRRQALHDALALYERARALRPAHAPTFLYLADVHQRLADFTASEVALSQALTLDPRFLDALILQGDVLRQRAGGLATADAEGAQAARLRARTSYDKALVLAPQNPWVRHQLGELAAELGDDVTAEKLLTEVRSLYPSDGELVLLLGHLAAKRKAHETAFLTYVDASQHLADDIRPWVFAGREALALERYDEADSLFDKALKVNPESGWANLERGYGQRLRRDWPGALRSARKATRYEPRNSEAWLFLGRLHQEQKEFESALVAYERASELAPLSALVDRALASALNNRAKPEDLLRAERLMKRPLDELSDSPYTHAIAGYTWVKLAKTSETNLPRPTAPETRENRKLRWSEMGAFELTRALELSPDDRSMRLAAAVAFSELGRYEASRKTVAPLLEGGARPCPTDEWSWKWNEQTPPPVSTPANSPQEALAREDEQLRAEAHLLSGDLYAREDELPSAAGAPGVRSRLAYFCALQWLPARADTHLRLAASYESVALLRLAEMHFLAAAKLDPANVGAQQGLERLRKEGGYPVGPVRVAGLMSFVSDFIPGEVQSRQSQVLGYSERAQRQLLLTTPRTVTIGADASWQKASWRSKLRLGLGYQFGWGKNSFLNDLTVFEDRQSHRAELFAAGRFGEFKDQRYELSWRGGYRFTFANAQTRREFRHQVYAQGRLLRVDWGTADAELGYELGNYVPTAPSFSDRVGHSGFWGLRVSPILRKWQVDLTVGYRAQIVALVPSSRTIWLHELVAEGRKTWVRWFLGGDVRGGLSTDTRPDGGTLNAAAGSVTLRGHFGYAWSGYSRVLGRTGMSWVPNQPEWNSVLVGALGEHRFVFRGVGDADQGLSVGASYDLRITYGLGRAEHLVSAVVTLGQ